MSSAARLVQADRLPTRLVAIGVLTVLAPQAGAGELRVTVEGIRSSRGTVLIGLYDSAASFDKAVDSSTKEGFLIDPERFGAVALRANAALKSAVVFSNLDRGRYAAVAFHDENGDGKLDKNFLGVPTEPYGFSNDAQGFLGPPTFDAAAVALGGGDEAIRIAFGLP
jgi:uncharacterized protein (DUF2141 family)